jgi:DNA repair exonuclease SbcCD ATPase subunit
MKHVNFKHLIIKNFLSVGEKPVELTFKPGLNIITGTNKDKEDRRNGVGKSTVADALYFAIFGDTLREINTKYIKNNLTDGKVKVSLEFDIVSNNVTTEIYVERTLNPAKVFLKINGEDKTRDSIANTNTYIESLLSTNADIFQHCVTLTINNTIPFMGKKKGDKRKFIESIFNLEVFSKMSDRLKADINEVKNSYNTEFTRLSTLQTNYNSINSRSENFEEERRNRLEKYLKRKKDNNAELAVIEDYLRDFKDVSIAPIKEKITTANENLKKSDAKINDFYTKISQTDTEITHLNYRYKTIGTKEDKCPVCARSILDHDREHIDSEKEKTLEEINQKKQEKDKLQADKQKFDEVKAFVCKQTNDLNKKLKEAELELVKYENNKIRKEQLKGWLNTLNDDIEVVAKQENSFKKLISESKDSITESETKIETIKNLSKVLDNVKFVVSEEGVKSYIIKKILQLFNNKIAYYLSKLDSNCVLIFDEYFEEKIINDKGIECSYNNFSGAEKKTIDLACLFAFMDIRRLQGDVAYNVCLFDELLDSSFDEKGVELVLDVLKDRSDMYSECCYIISHRKESIKAATGEIIYLEKYNGLTQRMEFTGL